MPKHSAWLLAAFLFAALAAGATAQTPKGLWLVTSYPEVAVQAGDTSTFKFDLHNTGLPPQLVTLSVDGAPKDWRIGVMGGGRPVQAVMPFTDNSVTFELRLDIPRDQAAGTYKLTVRAQGADAKAELPLQVTLGAELPAKLELQPKLPSLRGSPSSSFDYEFTLKNDSGRNLLVSLAADVPPNFQASFSENYGSQSISSIPVASGESKTMKVKVQPPGSASAGDYKLLVQAAAEGASAQLPLELQLSGQPKVRLTGPEGRLSAQAEAGKITQIEMTLTNDGSAPASEVAVSATPPTDWKVEFNPKAIPMLPPGEKAVVTANVTPSTKAVAGDYMLTVRASGKGDSSSADFRIGVTTSTLWGAFGIGIIAIALLVLVGAVARFGRR